MHVNWCLVSNAQCIYTEVKPMTLVLSKVFKTESSQIHLLSILFHKRSSINHLDKQVNTLETRFIVSNLTVLITKHEAVQCLFRRPTGLSGINPWLKCKEGCTTGIITIRFPIPNSIKFCFPRQVPNIVYP